MPFKDGPSESDEEARARNLLVGWNGFSAECVESPGAGRKGMVSHFGGEYVIVHATKKYFYFFLDFDQERWRVLRSDVLHSPVGKMVSPE
jgi:hypothetical protein